MNEEMFHLLFSLFLLPLLPLTGVQEGLTLSYFSRNFFIRNNICFSYRIERVILVRQHIVRNWQLLLRWKVTIECIDELGMIETVIQAIQSNKVQYLPHSAIILVLFIVVVSLHQITAVFQYFLMELPMLKALWRYSLNQVTIKIIHIVRISH